MSDDGLRQRLLGYFSHRYVSLIQILKESIRSKRLMKGNKNALPPTVESEGIVNTDMNKRFTLKNKNLYDKMQYHDEGMASAEAEKELIAYKESRGLPSDTKIFKILGKYHKLRDEFVRRGWVEHDWEEIDDTIVTEHF